jgi:hypothetical protein
MFSVINIEQILKPMQHQFYEVKLSREQMQTFEAHDWLVNLYGHPSPCGEWNWIIGSNETRHFYFADKQAMDWFVLRWA